MTAFYPPYPTGEIRIDREDAGAVLRLDGEIDAAVVQAFEQTLEGPPPRIVAVDAGAVTFLSSHGVGLILRLTQEHRRSGGRPSLRRTSRATSLVMEVTGTDQLFDG